VSLRGRGIIRVGRERPSASLVPRRRLRIVAVAVDVAPNGRVGRSTADTSILRSHPLHRNFRARRATGTRRVDAGLRADTLVWQPDPRWTGATGNPVDLAAAEVQMLDESPDVYVCGPPPMIEAAYAALTAAGVPREQIHEICTRVVGPPL
jgi:hypothetical protein